MVEACGRDVFYAGLREACTKAGLTERPKIEWSADKRLLERVVGFDSPNSSHKQLFFSPDVIELIFKQQDLPNIMMPTQTISNSQTKQFKSVADIQKFEKRERINSDRAMLQKARKCTRGQKSILCFDLEAYEMDHTKLTEIGLSFSKGCECENRHFILQEHANLINSVYVDDHKYDFAFGESELISMKNAFQELEAYVRKADAILAHSLSSDLILLEIAGQGRIVELIQRKASLDTQKIYRSWGRTWVRIALEDLCEMVDVNTTYLHNAGNDAYLTLQCLKKMTEARAREGAVKTFEEMWKQRREQRRKEDELNGGQKKRGPQFEDELFQYRIANN